MRKLCLIALLWIFLPLAAQAQFLGYAAQQTVTTGFTVPAGNPTATTIVNLSNIGQAGHSIFYQWTGAGHSCNLELQASGDGLHWRAMTNGPQLDVPPISRSRIVFGSGYFPFLRIMVNPNLFGGCTNGVAGTYTGYQVPVPSPQYSVQAVSDAIAAPVDVPALVSTAVGTPILQGFQCFNPNAAPAYLQINQSAVLGSDIHYQIGIAQEQTFVYSGPPIYFDFFGWSAGASTTASGNVAVAAPLVCTFQLDPFSMSE